MENFEQGDVIIGPSSKGNNHLTFTWKVSNKVFQHIDVKEEDKANAVSPGKRLWIESECFGDLDGIIARHETPMAGFVREVMRFKYFKKLAVKLKIYVFFFSKYKRQAYVTVTCDGMRYRGQKFSNINNLVNWSKLHFNDAVTANQQMNPVTSQDQSIGSTRYNAHLLGCTGYNAPSTRSIL
ncbi:hypothetical protein HELRODRAFT_173911 [Helobdella robusta]|uniref:Spt6 SH2 domain-containing protein n=1 Tax=Helobdella robusta TaxID=6412 RepID=T1F7D1_HELRO|nr:hypothetical protein HELRODRAFT_173911 [Helobdella robusta]ESO03043.1 hypothetical protein HELRODRAFT_173911 [Helobdella robusta]